MTELQQMHVRCIDLVFACDYYVRLFDQVRSGRSLEELKSMSRGEEITSFWNQFWFDLPDNRTIHRQPFNEICEICEYDYRDEEEMD